MNEKTGKTKTEKEVKGKTEDRMHYWDATDGIFGKIASQAAKLALNKDHIVIVNAEKCIINGNPKFLHERWKTRLDLEAKGDPEKGPKASKLPDLLLKYAIRGMMTYKDTRGRDAIRRVRVHIGMPENLKSKPFEKIENVHARPRYKYMTLRELSRQLGANI